MTAESRAGHFEIRLEFAVQSILTDALLVEGGVFPQEFYVGFHIDIEMGAVGTQAGVQSRGAARSKVAADVRCAEEHNLGFVLCHKVAYELCVRVSGIVVQQGRLADVDLVRAVTA